MRFIQTFKMFKGTFIITGIFLVSFTIDAILRLIGGTSFLDFVLGRNVTTGIYHLVWFKASYFWNGEIWRAITWSFFSSGLLSFIVELIVLIFLSYNLEKWIGAKKLLLTYFLLNIVILFASLLSYCDQYHDIHFDLGMVGMVIMLFALAGYMFTLAFTKGYDQTSEFKSGKFTKLSVIVYLILQIIYFTVRGYGQFAIFYAFSFGMCAGLITSYGNQNIFANKVNGQKKQLIPITKTKMKDYPFTLMVIGISIVVFLLNSILVDKNLLNKIYGAVSFKTWVNYFLTGGDYGYVAQWLLADMEKIRQGQVWRLITHVFSHMGLIHMATNMPAIYFAGKYVENKIGSIKTVIVYLCSAFVVSLLSLVEGSNSTTLGGSSLSIYALLAMFLLYAFTKDNRIKSHMYEFIYVILYFLLGNIPSIGAFGEAHLTSFMVGFSAVFIIRTTEGDNSVY